LIIFQSSPTFKKLSFNNLDENIKNLEPIMSDRVKKFREEREKLNALILERENLNIKRFFGIDTAVYRDGALDARTKEMLGLVASLVLRCDDCINYHLLQIKEQGIKNEEFDEIMSVGLVVGGSITIPHIRRAYRMWEELKDE
jgi:AhpD family alkylhydroperoxidase